MLLSPELKAGAITGRVVKIRADDIFMILIFLGWIAKMAVNKEFGFLRATSLNKPIIAYALICIIATFIGLLGGHKDLKQSFFYLLKYLEYFLLFFMVSNNLKNIRQAKKFIFFILLTCLLVCLFAASQIHTGERLSAPFEGEGGEPNTFAGYLIIMMSLMIGLILYSETEKEKFFLVPLLGLSGVAFLLTLSRGGWISFFPMIMTFIIMTKKYRIQLIAFLAIALVLVLIFAPKQVHRRVEETFVPWKTYKVLGTKLGIDESASARIDSWKVGLELWTKKPIFGYDIPAGTVIDNQYTRVLGETGIIGFFVFIWLVFTVFRMALSNYQNMDGNNFAQGLSLGFLAGFIGVMTISTTVAAFIVIRIMEPFWFLAAIVVMLPELRDEPEIEEG